MKKIYFPTVTLMRHTDRTTLYIQILTLALGLVCFLLAAGVFLFWTSADDHFDKAARTFVITTEWQLIDGGESSGGAIPLTPHQLASHLRSDFPQLESVARTTLLDRATPVRTDTQRVRLRSVAADSEFLTIFDLPFLHGNAQTALDAPRSVVITEAAALALYGDTQVVGRVITLYDDYVGSITGVLGQIPEPSHMGTSVAAPLQFDLLVSRDFYESQVSARTGGRDTTQLPADWFSISNTTYVLFPDDEASSADQLRGELPEFVRRHVPELQRQQADFKLDVVPVSNLLVIAIRDTLFPQQTIISPPLLILLLGVVVLVVACINFANLATTQALSRGREIALRKTIGATPAHIAFQHLCETAAQTVIAFLLAGLFIVIMTPLVRGAVGIDLGIVASQIPMIRGFVFSVGLASVVTLMAGFYPAFVMARVQPAKALKINTASDESRTFVSVLIGVQFALAAFLLVLLTNVFLQNRELQRALNDISGESLLIIENSTQTTGVQQTLLRQELLQLPDVQSVTAMEVLPWANALSRIPLTSSPSSLDVEQAGLVYVVGQDFFKTLGIDLVAGRSFDPLRSEDIAATRPDQLVGIQNLIVSQSLAENLGYEDPSLAVGQAVYIPRNIVGGEQARPYNIIGVVEDKALSISNRFGKISQVYLFSPEMRFQVVRVSPSNIDEAIESIDLLWQQLAPDTAIQRRFVSDYFNDSYAAFNRVSQTFTVLSLLACLLSVIGLYAMATHITRRRIREVAIRKALGASRTQVVLMLIKCFSVPVVVANIVALPFAYIAVRSYLDVFVDPIALTAMPFVVTLITSLLLAWVAVGGRAIIAANTSPQIVMRSE